MDILEFYRKEPVELLLINFQILAV